MQERRGTRGWWATVGPVLAVLDPAAVVLATVLGFAQVGWGPLVLGAEAAFLVTLAAGRQRSRLRLSLLADLPWLGLAALAAAGTMVLASEALVLEGTGGWLEAGALAMLVLAVLVLARGAVYGVARLARRSRRFATEAVLVGVGRRGREMAEALAARPEIGLVPVGFVDSGTRSSARGLPLPFLGSLAALPRVLDEHVGADVVFCFDTVPDEATEDVVRDCLGRSGRVFVAPDHWRPGAGRGRTEELGDVRLTRLHGWPRARHRRNPSPGPSAPAPRADQPQVHAGQLAS